MHRVAADPLEIARTRTSAKWRMYEPDVLPLPVAEMDFPLAEPIAKALHDAVDRSDTGYAAASRPLAESFASFALARHAWVVDPTQAISAADVSTAIIAALGAVTAPGDGVVICPPVYPPFFTYPGEVSARTVEVPLAGGIDGGWALDLPGLAAAFAAGATTMVLCNPHNPVGYVPSRAELAALADLAAAHQVTVIADEVHGPLTYAGATFTPFLTVSDAAREHGIAITSPSKAFNLAGLKAALIVTDGERGAAARRRLPYELEWQVGQFGAIGGIAAWTEGGEWLDGVLTSLDDNRKLLATELARVLPGVRYRIPDATYLAWLDLSVLGWGDNPAAHALTRGRVALSPGPDFGPAAGRGHARLNFACSPEIVIEALGRLAAAAALS
ncbi:MAG TPA: aminotransferase class I/II-fold pyridoxal phosphate-dependent enzyme [Candidatus Lumbricidophila sp.]|nr:aminotransferase class I/II-fold pyridoxal phosphate-dependent enzyme [Candidatus Lumbricidophila sp.]